MLVLSRVIGEQVVIGEEIVVTVLDIQRGRVRLGIAAPPQCPILRMELRSPSGAGDEEPFPVGRRGRAD